MGFTGGVNINEEKCLKQEDCPGGPAVRMLHFPLQGATPDQGTRLHSPPPPPKIAFFFLLALFFFKIFFLMWTISFKVFIESVTVLFLCFCF